MATAANPFDIKTGGTLTNASGTNTAAQFNPEQREVDAAKETTSGQLQSILQKDSPLMQLARTQATQGMAQRGLINSSMNQGAGVAAMLEKATPIAASDAATYSNRSMNNQAAVNTGGMFNAGEQNKFGLQTGAQQFATTERQAGQEFAATQAGLERQQQSQLQVAQQTFQGAQSNLDRAQQLGLTDKSIEAQQALQKAQQDFTGAQSNLDRLQQSQLQTSQQTFQAGQSQLEREQQLALQTGQQQFTAGQAQLEREQQSVILGAQQRFTAAQAELDRAQQVALSDKSIEAQAALQKAQQNFTASQSELDRAQQTQLATAQQTFQKIMQDNQLSFTGTQAEKDRAQQLAIQKMQEAGLDVRQATQIAAQERAQTSQQTFQEAQAGLDRTQQQVLQASQQTFTGTQADKDRAQQQLIVKLQETGMDVRQATQLASVSAEAAKDRAQQTAMQVGQQEFTAGQNKIQNDFQTSIAKLQESGLDFRQARDIASREAIQALQEKGITNRFDQELALKSSQFDAEQINLAKRQIADNAAQLDRLGLQIKANQQTIPTTFAANISNTTMSGVNSIMADGNLTAAAKTAAINNLVTYANAQIDWATKFYGTTIPKLSTPA